MQFLRIPSLSSSHHPTSQATNNVNSLNKVHQKKNPLKHRQQRKECVAVVVFVYCYRFACKNAIIENYVRFDALFIVAIFSCVCLPSFLLLKLVLLVKSYCFFDDQIKLEKNLQRTALVV